MHRILAIFPCSRWSPCSPRMHRRRNRPPISGTSLKNKARVSNDILKVKTPKPAESKLKNGMELLVLEDHRSPTIQIQIHARIQHERPRGSPDQQRDHSFNAPRHQDEELEADCRGHRRSWDLGILWHRRPLGYGRLLHAQRESGRRDGSCLGHAGLIPAFPEDEVGKVEESTARATDPSPRTAGLPRTTERFAYAMYPNDQRSLVLPSAEGINKITRDLVVEHYNRVFRPEGGRVTVIGDITAKQITPKLEKFIGTWKGAAPETAGVADRQCRGCPQNHLCEPPDFGAQTSFYMGEHAVDRLNPDYIAVQVLNRVLGGGPAASRLFRNIREEGLSTYGISSGFTASRYMNHFAVQTSTCGPRSRAMRSPRS